MGLSGTSFVAYLQNHDQLGNRARGDRISHLTNLERAKIGAALVMLSPFIPLVFQGEEWGATSPFQFFVDFHSNPELAQSVREGRRAEFVAFGWKSEDVPDPVSLDTFRRSKLDWNECSYAAHRDMVEWYRRLINVRRTYAGLTDGRLDVIRTRFDESQEWLIVERGVVLVVCNFATEARVISLDRTRFGKLLLASKDDIRLDENTLHIREESVAIFTNKEVPP
jgi:maltooligosyltrehalose trehalohydrolase